MTSTTGAVTSLTGPANAAAAVGVADGTGSAATFTFTSFGSFAGPIGLTTDGVNLYITDTMNYKIRMIAPPAGTKLSAATNANATVSSVTGTANTASAALLIYTPYFATMTLATLESSNP